MSTAFAKPNELLVTVSQILPTFVFFQHKAVGQALFDEVCRHLNLLECDYFGLEFLDCFGNRVSFVITSSIYPFAHNVFYF